MDKDAQDLIGLIQDTRAHMNGTEMPPENPEMPPEAEGGGGVYTQACCTPQDDEENDEDKPYWYTPEPDEENDEDKGAARVAENDEWEVPPENAQWFDNGQVDIGQVVEVPQRQVDIGQVVEMPPEMPPENPETMNLDETRAVEVPGLVKTELTEEEEPAGAVGTDPYVETVGPNPFNNPGGASSGSGLGVAPVDIRQWPE